MKIYRCVKTDRLSQGFGDNLPCSPEGQLTPVVSYSNGTCPIGYTKLYPKLNLKGHNGYDLVAYRGEPVYHAGDFSGWVKTEVDQNGGIGVRVVSDTPQLGQNCATLIYWHLLRVMVYDGQKVQPGAVLGLADSTGLSSGDHVHFALKESTDKGVSLNTGNGYFGCIDPTPYFENKFVVDVMRIQELRVKLGSRLQQLIFYLKMLLGRR